MKLKTSLFVLTACAFLASCAAKVIPADAAAGTYNGTLTAGTTDTSATCVLQKVNDNLVKLTCTPQGGGGGLVLDSVSVTGTQNPYSLSKSGVLTGSVNGNTLTWTDGAFYSFTGTK